MVRQELGGGQVAQGLMRPDMVIGVLPGPQGRPESAELEPAFVAFIELLGMGPLGSLHMAVEFGRAWRQDKQPEAPPLARLLEIRLR